MGALIFVGLMFVAHYGFEWNRTHHNPPPIDRVETTELKK